MVDLLLMLIKSSGATPVCTLPEMSKRDEDPIILEHEHQKAVKAAQATCDRQNSLVNMTSENQEQLNTI